MTDLQSIYLALLCVALLGASAFAYTGVKNLRSLGSRVPANQRLAAHLGLAGAALMILAACLSLMATLQGETDNWGLPLTLFATSVGCTWTVGIVARLYTGRPTS